VAEALRRVAAAAEEEEAAPLCLRRHAACGRGRARGDGGEAPRREHAGRMCFELALLTAVSAELAPLPVQGRAARRRW
jgi:hypothetical protein